MRSELRAFPENKRGMLWPSTKYLSFSPTPLGRGGYSSVFQATDPSSGKIYAVKVTNLSKISAADEKNVMKELDAYLHFSHQRIIRFYDYIIENRVIFFILELATKGSLYSHIRSQPPLPTSEIKRLFSQILEGVAYVHSRDFLIRDIKSANILLDENLNVKLCDFGWSCHTKNIELWTAKCGTYPYMSPEALRGTAQDTSSDIWSLGVILYELHFKKEPFPGTTEEQMIRLINNGNINYSVPGVSISREGIALISSMLQVSPRRRPKIKEIIHHSFFDSAKKIRAASPSEAINLSKRTRLFSPSTGLFEARRIQDLSPAHTPLRSPIRFDPMKYAEEYGGTERQDKNFMKRPKVLALSADIRKIERKTLRFGI